MSTNRCWPSSEQCWSISWGNTNESVKTWPNISQPVTHSSSRAVSKVLTGFKCFIFWRGAKGTSHLQQFKYNSLGVKQLKKPKEVKWVGVWDPFSHCFAHVICRDSFWTILTHHLHQVVKLGTARTVGLKCDTTHHNLMRPLGLRATQPHSPCTHQHTHTVNQNREHLAQHPRALFKENKKKKKKWFVKDTTTAWKEQDSLFWVFVLMET